MLSTPPSGIKTQRCFSRTRGPSAPMFFARTRSSDFIPQLKERVAPTKGHYPQCACSFQKCASRSPNASIKRAASGRPQLSSTGGHIPPWEEPSGASLSSAHKTVSASLFLRVVKLYRKYNWICPRFSHQGHYKVEAEVN